MKILSYILAVIGSLSVLFGMLVSLETAGGIGVVIGGGFFMAFGIAIFVLNK
jgi:hypothetical protein